MKKFEPFIRKLKTTPKEPPKELPPQIPIVVRKFSPKLKPVYDMKKKNYPDNRRDEDSQTEDIFFKM